MDSGRGPSEEDPDALRSSSTSSHNHSASFNDSHDSAETSQQNNSSNYIDMSQVRKHMRTGNNNSSSSSKYKPSTGPSTRQVLMNPNGTNTSAPVVPPRAGRLAVHQQQHQRHPRTAIIHPQYSRKPATSAAAAAAAASFPDLNVPTASNEPQDLKPKQLTSNAASNKLYDCDARNVAPAATRSLPQPHPQQYHHHQQQHPQQQQQHANNDVSRCTKHNVVDHFPELCQRQQQQQQQPAVTSLWSDRPASDVIDADSRSEGGSTTSGSYMVDNCAMDHLDLGVEVSRDIFV